MVPRQTWSPNYRPELRPQDQHLRALAMEIEALDNAIDQVRGRSQNVRYYLMKVLYKDR